ncbi:FtsH protease activity modulator HflK [Thermodesulfovibrionales bacterium]|nr:FtsH protease activity modulator HflK [Thermodesulfovibrionales bacterium]
MNRQPWSSGGGGFKMPNMPNINIPWEGIRRKLGRMGMGKLIGLIAGIAVVVWLATGLYIVAPHEAGVVKQFGKFVGQTDPGLNWHIPFPIQTVNIVNVDVVRRAEIGFRTIEEPGRPPEHRPVPKEALMLTGGENIAHVELVVLYRVINPADFLFNVRDPERALHSAAEVAIRTAMGYKLIDYAMTVGRPTIAEMTRSFLQEMMDTYQTGLYVTDVKLQVVDPPEEVKDAFHEVVRALEDRTRIVMMAKGYAEKIVPEARGEAKKVVLDAEAYKTQRILLAQGDTARFIKLLEEYQKARDVTRTRLHLETAERVLADTDKFIIDGGTGGGDVVQLLPLKDLIAIERPVVEEDPGEEDPGAEVVTR